MEPGDALVCTQKPVLRSCSELNPSATLSALLYEIHLSISILR
jgi:hypothetical protein